MAASLPKKSIIETLNLLSKGLTSSQELTQQCLNQIQKFKDFNAYITVNENAIESAKLSDERRKKGSARSLEGIPISIKDNFCTQSIKTTCSSKILQNFISPYDATVVKLLKDQGAIIIGKTNLDEFGMGAEGINTPFGVPINPYSLNEGNNRVAGGSSSGSAISVAQNSSLASLGSDTGGSIRLPAAYCGVVGLKPSYGLLSRFGLIAYASSLDTPSIMTNNVDDAKLLFEILNQYDPSDSTSLPEENRNTLKEKIKQLNLEGKDLTNFTIGIPKEYFVEELDDEITQFWSQSIEKLSNQGAKIEIISLPTTSSALSAYYILATSEASSNLARYDGIRYGSRDSSKDRTITRSNGFGPEVQRRILMGTFSLSASNYESYYLQAQKIREQIRKELDGALEKGIDVLLTPTSRSIAPEIKQNESLSQHLTEEQKQKKFINSYLNDVFTVPASLAGIPAMNVPVGFSKTGFPVGLQLISGRFQEQKLFKIAKFLELSAYIIEK